jgi:hypothetical protein
MLLPLKYNVLHPQVIQIHRPRLLPIDPKKYSDIPDCEAWERTSRGEVVFRDWNENRLSRNRKLHLSKTLHRRRLLHDLRLPFIMQECGRCSRKLPACGIQPTSRLAATRIATP